MLYLGLGKTVKVGELSYEGLELLNAKEAVVCAVKLTRCRKRCCCSCCKQLIGAFLVSKRDIPERGLTQTTQISYPRTTAISAFPPLSFYLNYH